MIFSIQVYYYQTEEVEIVVISTFIGAGQRASVVAMNPTFVFE